VLDQFLSHLSASPDPMALSTYRRKFGQAFPDFEGPGAARWVVERALFHLGHLIERNGQVSVRPLRAVPNGTEGYHLVGARTPDFESMLTSEGFEVTVQPQPTLGTLVSDSTEVTAPPRALLSAPVDRIPTLDDDWFVVSLNGLQRPSRWLERRMAARSWRPYDHTERDAIPERWCPIDRTWVRIHNNEAQLKHRSDEGILRFPSTAHRPAPPSYGLLRRADVNGIEVLSIDPRELPLALQAIGWLNRSNLIRQNENGDFSWPRLSGVRPMDDLMHVLCLRSGTLPVQDPHDEGRLAVQNLSQDDIDCVNRWMEG